MEFRSLGSSGIKVSVLSLGSWLTAGSSVDLDTTKLLTKIAFEQGVNFFDTAEGYGGGAAELIFGEALRAFPREKLVVSTKLFWGGQGANDLGHSRKRLTDGLKNSLRRLQMDYIDLLFCHRRDSTTSILETVVTMDQLIRQGHILYWGTSEWTKEDLEEAFRIAYLKNLHAPTMEQPEYNLLHRERVEKEYAPLYENYQLGLTTWSPLALGLLTGKYNQGIPTGSRLSQYPQFIPHDLEAKIKNVERLSKIASELGVSLAKLSIAWCLKNPHVSSVILGARTPEQLLENLDALQVAKLITKELYGHL